MRTNLEILSDAWTSLKGQRLLAIGTFVVYVILAWVLAFANYSVAGLTALLTDSAIVALNTSTLLQVLWAGAFNLGLTTFAINLSRRTNASFEDIFSGFNHWKTATWTYIVYLVRILLWMLLFIIPGIIKSLAYALTFFILSDNPQFSASQAIARSEELMYGHKWKLFLLFLWVVLLMVLSIFTLFIGLLWIAPWIYTAIAKFYDEVKADWLRRNIAHSETIPTPDPIVE